MSKQILDEIKNVINDFETGTTEIVDGLSFQPSSLIKNIEFYTNSKYLNGQYESDGRYKPFYNIVNFRVNVATRATDFDTKDFQIYSENPNHFVKSMLFTKEIKNWMRRVNFAKTLNEFGFTRAKYGGVLVKRVKRDGELYLEIPEWKNVIFDPVEINKGVIIEKHYLTPVDIQKKSESWKFVDENKDEIEKAFTKEWGKNYTNTSRCLVYEVEGEFPKSMIDEDTDYEDYTLQKHYILAIGGVPKIVLHSEEVKERNYMYLDWLKASGRGLGIGIVEDGIEAQIATNDTILKQRDIMESASKLSFVTDSEEITQNINAVEYGHIHKIGRGEQFYQLNQTPNSLPQMDNIIKQWDEQLSRATSTFEAITGETMPSGTPFRAVAMQNQEAQSVFNYRKEEAGIFWRELFTSWIIPHLKSKLTRKHILSSDFTDDELRMIDNAFATKKANDRVFDAILNGKVTTQDEYDQMLEAEKELLARGVRDERFIEIPDGYFKDAEFEIDVITTGEQINKSVIFESITNILNTVAQNPAILDDPRLSQLFAKIIELSGVGLSPDIFLQKVEKPLEMQEQVQLTAEEQPA